MLVRGAIATPCKLGPLSSAEVTVSLRFYVPEKCNDYTSVSLAFYDAANKPSYAMVILKNPGTPVGQGELNLGGKVPVNLKPATWYSLQLKHLKGSGELRVWAAGDPVPEKPQATGSLGDLKVTQVGVRVYGDDVEVAQLEVAGSPGVVRTLDRTKLPQPVFDAHPEYIELYDKAWEMAFDHVADAKGLPQTPYMDEACWDWAIWIWDSCFMSLFCRYSPEQFPGIESLSNFYVPMHDKPGDSQPQPIVHPDNPPLFAWAEHDYFQFTGDKKRLRWLLNDKQYLQKHYQWFQNARRGSKPPWAYNAVNLKPQPLGFEWDGQHSGMDNTPRFDGGGVLAVDALAQQGLSALYISRLAGEIGDTKLRDEWKAEYDRVKKLVNDHYWDEKDGFYYDLKADGKTFTRRRSVASFWPVFAGMASKAQTERMAAYIRDPKEMGGYVPFVSLSRSDKDFNAQSGDYWRGAMWLPTAYMGIRALEENGQAELADKSAETILWQMSRTYQNFSPRTIWECYNPNKDEPSTEHGRQVRPEFCGWSALGPISLFIENVLGFHDVNAATRTVSWRLHQGGRHGIKALRFGDVRTDIVTDGKGMIEVNSSNAYTLKVNGKSFVVKKGKQHFKM